MPVPVDATTPEAARDLQSRIRAACDIVVSDPEILGGMLVIKGTRVPVYTVGSWLVNGEPMDVILNSYPSVTREQVELAAVYVDAFPYEEEPYQRPELPPGATLIYSSTEPLRKRA